MTTAFDADVLVYAAAPLHPLGARVAPLFSTTPDDGPVGVGSLLLLTEVLAKPLRQGSDSDEALTLISYLGRLDLLPVDAPTARLALALAVRYGLRAADATHLATAVAVGADRFLTNNRKDFPRSITELDVVYPDDLPAP
ncbi:type II toxin-antitoxin system VapC family toxin [Luteimicrobium sp. DT211]|uniref:type II toxin-antitoxin system VapC family toxin n=1 Tax=Luteimicrobium sp. DT211 TaxID=3393412 RepID=UPI003CF87AE5